MKQLYFLTIAILILLIGISGVFAEESGQAEAGTGIVPSPIKTKFLGPADRKFIDVAERYIKQKLGENYYSRFISFQSGESFEDCIENECTVRNEISFDYDMPFEIVGDPHLGGPVRIQITVDDKENIVNYVGPVKPYQFLISKEEAIEKAKSYGLVEITDAGIATSLGGSEGYELVWAVSSNDLVECKRIGGFEECIYKGVYVDVDTGEIRGEYRINPLIQTSSGMGGVKLGEFFEEQEVQIPINVGIIILVIIVLGVISLGWLKFYKK